MKRVRQRADRCGQAKPEHVSGCRQFEGEDLGYFDRMAMNAALQREWADQQVREHREENARAKEEEKNWAGQEVAINRLRGMLEDENHARQAAYQRSCVDFNKQMAREKREREQNWRDD